MRIKALIFLSFYLLALLSPVKVMIDFALNQKEIAEEFCENKDKPEMNCDGKCHLSKMLAEQSTEEEEKPVSRIQLEYPVGKVELFNITHPTKYITSTSFPKITEAELPAFLISIEHPPTV